MATLSISWPCIIVKCLVEIYLHTLFISEASMPMKKQEKIRKKIKLNFFQNCLATLSGKSNPLESKFYCKSKSMTRFIYIPIFILLGPKTSKKWGKCLIHKIEFGNPVYFMALYHCEMSWGNIFKQIIDSSIFYTNFG